jgi:beta-lactamase regulating signal transducer with metallopeptidase domain
VPPDLSTLGRWAAVVWFAVGATLAAGQLVRIVQFRRQLRDAVPAPAWLVGEAEWAGRQLGVRVPEALVVPGIGTPLLWCLGRPKLLLPAGLIETLDVNRWRGVLVHELAHLRRRDPWVRRIEIVAGWVWWWNPLYWIARHRIDALAELACDAWVVWALPADRIVYAETLLDICASLAIATPRTPSRTPAPALGVTSSGRFFEGRLKMILSDHVDCRPGFAGLLGAGLLTLLALPSWIVAETPGERPRDRERPVALTTATRGVEVALADPEADAVDPVDPAQKTPEPKGAERPKPSGDEPSTPAGDKDKDKDKGKDTDKDKDKNKDKTKDGSKFKIEIDLSPVEKVFGADSEVVKHLERLGKEVEKAVEEQLGPGSPFEARMKELSERMEARFGAGSKFHKEMMDKMKEAHEAATAPFLKQKDGEETRPGLKPGTRPWARTGKLSKDRRIKELEARIDQLRDELKKLESEDGEDAELPPAGTTKGK